ncbi:MAG: enoyl-CoA hydratase/isomerase family protein [Actinobacteria bacterium]|nr:enoyl-CoA hydratase/isomerase family protein [Actinomycetota bacterium]
MPIRLDRDGATALVVLDRPEKGNALSARDLLHDLPEIWGTVRDDATIRAVVVTGAGDRSFTSGADVTDPDLLRRIGTASDQAPMRFTGRQFEVWKPILTAVNGRCFGGGLWFLGDCDFALAAEHATFANPGVGVGMVVASGSVSLARRASFAAVLRMAVLGPHDVLTADDARRAGFVQRVTPAGSLLDAALADAAAISRNSPAAVEQMIRTLWAAQSLPLDAALACAEAAQAAWRGHPDAIEGPAARAEGRDPQWAAPEPGPGR